jgi:hypothetical protein
LRKTTLMFAVCASLLAGVGCGEGEGVAGDAVVAVYVAAPLCPGSQLERAREVRVRFVCLEPVERGGRLDLAQIGANARRATEDSASVAYVEQAGAAARFSRSIVESAGIAYVVDRSGEAIERVLETIEATGGAREDVAGTLR